MKQQSLTIAYDNQPPAGPNYNELERMEALTDAMARAVMVAQNRNHERVSLDRDVAEELLQMMSDGLRTAKELKGATR